VVASGCCPKGKTHETNIFPSEDLLIRGFLPFLPLTKETFA
jgi:hypothetical protein